MILGIDTSLGTAVAVIEPVPAPPPRGVGAPLRASGRGGPAVVRSQLESTDPRGHAEVIGTLIARALAEASVRPADITQVAAGMGPGPFTGLRVGIAAARAFALGRGIPVVPVVSHDAVALEVLRHDVLQHDVPAGGFDAAVDQPFAVVTDARRREFAYTVYQGLDDDGLPVRRTSSALTPRDEIEAALAGAIRWDAERIPAATLALAASRALAAGREIGPRDALYLRSPDVTVPGAPKRVTS